MLCLYLYGSMQCNDVKWIKTHAFSKTHDWEKSLYPRELYGYMQISIPHMHMYIKCTFCPFKSGPGWRDENRRSGKKDVKWVY